MLDRDIKDLSIEALKSYYAMLRNLFMKSSNRYQSMWADKLMKKMNQVRTRIEQLETEDSNVREM